MIKQYYVYIVTNSTNSVLYIGVTNNIERRIYEHKHELIEGFTEKYKVKKLIYLEEYINIKDAIAREKQLKNWHRDWKINLIKKINPDFKELAEDDTLGYFKIDPETSSG
jgi:putative endonuclease